MKAGALLRASGLVVLVFAACWLAAVLYWRAAGVEVGAGHLLAWLLVLPLLVLATVLGVRALLRRRRARRETGEAPGGATDDGESPAVPDRPLHLHAAAAWTRVGAEPAAIAAALADPVRPPLHPRLRDSMGLPVFAAEVEDLDPDWAGKVPDDRRAVTPVHALRALALLEPVAEDLFLAVAELDGPRRDSTPAMPTLHDGLHPHAMHHSRSAQAPEGVAQVPPVQVHLLLPGSWPTGLREAAVDRMKVLAAGVGLAGDRFAIEVVAATDAGEGWRLLERIGARVQASEPPVRDAPHLLLVADSLLDPQTVERLESRQQLLVSGHLEGRIPGEAAAGVLLASSRALVAADPSGADAPVRLHRAFHAHAERGRAAVAGSSRLLQDALAAAAPEQDVAAVFTDADHRPSRAVEAAGAINAAFPDQDAVEDARHLGVACGDTGVAAPLVLLAAAAAHVRSSGSPALVLGLATDERTALAISPLPQPDGPPAADPDATPAATAAATA